MTRALCRAHVASGRRGVLGTGGILLDANALLLPFRERFPLEAELQRLGAGRELRVPDSVRRELARLQVLGEPHARAALELADRFQRIVSQGSGDDALLGLARRTGAWVVTADRELAGRLHRDGVTVLRPRGRSHLGLVPGRPAPPTSPPRRTSRPSTKRARRPQPL